MEDTALHAPTTALGRFVGLFAMMYARGAKVADEYDVAYVKHAARVGAELGADVV